MYTVDHGTDITDKELEYIKRNLFRKYNCGMTALSTSEIARAKYLYDPLTIYLKETIENDQDLFDKCTYVLLNKSKKNETDREKINFILVAIRELLTTPYIPIVNVNNVKMGTKVIGEYYETFIVPQDIKEVASEFSKIFDKVYCLKEKMFKDDYLLQDNILFFKSVYWMLSLIFKQYTSDFYEFDMDRFYDYIKNEGKAIEYFDNYKNINSNHIINRHKYVKRYIDIKLDKVLVDKINQYLDNAIINKRKVVYKPIKKPNNEEVWHSLEPYEKLKTYISDFTVEEISKHIKNNRFIIREEYQRMEVKNKVKASRIIESILLGIKIPPIYIILETGEDKLDTYTVIDGQQRLISILTYMGEPILDGRDSIIPTYKNKYGLTGLKDLDLNEYVFDSENTKINDPILKNKRLNDTQRKKILDYKLEAIVIDKKTNPDFKPVDMFLRLNQSPCNISENSFEMWNSYNIIDTLEYIKQIARYDLFKQYGNKMKEEELVVILAYMDILNITIENIRDFLRVYLFTENKDKANERLEVKLSINNKKAITNYLEKLEPDSLEEEKFNKSLESVKEFIKKLNILTDRDSSKLIKIFNPYIGVARKANMKDFYVTWLIFRNLDNHIIKAYSKELLKDLEEIFKLMKKMPDNSNEEFFIARITKIIGKYENINVTV